MSKRVKRKKGGFTVLRKAITLGALCLGASTIPYAHALALDAGALPMGGTVVGGNASFDYTTPNELHVQQTSDRAVINWDSFNIGHDAITQFHQNSSSAIAVNRVTGAGVDPTQILGTLKANGKIVVLDRNGVVFDRDSIVDVGGIIASTGDIDTQSFMQGETALKITGADQGEIRLNGQMTVADAGLAAFVAPTVVNNGVINAKLGHVDLAGATQATVDLYGDGITEVAVPEESKKTFVENAGSIQANGGRVTMTAAAAKKVVDAVVNMSGIVTVASVEQKGGKIILSGASETKVSGKLDASGKTGGGEILIGGDYQGKGSVQHSQKTTVEKDAALTANVSGDTGDGGKVVLWSDDSTYFAGSIDARGGAVSGNGGTVETSGKINLGVAGSVDASAYNGLNGEWLLDPSNVIITGSGGNNIPGAGGTINPTSDSYQISASSIQAALNNGNNVTIATTNASGTQPGDITTSGTVTISKTSGADATLTLRADRDIGLYNATITSSGSGGKLNVVLNADKDANQDGAVALGGTSINTNGGYFVAGGGSGTLFGTDGIFGTADDASSTGADNVAAWGNANYNSGVSLFSTSSINAGGGNIILNGHGSSVMTVNSNHGIAISGSIQSSGSSMVRMAGTGGGTGTTSTSNTGVYLGNSISGGSGGIYITGTGGGTTNGAGVNYGAQISSDIISGGGPIVINATGGLGAGNNRGFRMNSGNIRAGSGAITISGISGANTTEDFNISGGTIGGAGQTGNIAFNLNTLNNAGTIVSTTGSLLLKPRTATTAINLGGPSGSGTLDINDAELALMDAGVLVFGDSVSGTGDVVVDSWDLSAKTHNVELYGNDITFQDTGSAGYAVNLGTGNVTARAKDNGADVGSIFINKGFLKSVAGTSDLNLLADRDVYMPNAIINSTTGSLNIQFNGDRNANADGSIFVNGGSITTNGGYFVAGGGAGVLGGTNGILGDGDGTGTDDAVATGNDRTTNTNGIYINNANVQTGAGQIILRGQGGSAATQSGVFTTNATIASTTGNISIKGYGGSGASGASGSYITSNSLVSSQTGNIDIFGQAGGTGAGGYSDPVNINGATIRTQSSDSAKGTITIYGDGTTSSAPSKRGVGLFSGALVETNASNIFITGKANASFAVGTWQDGVIVRSNAGGNITLAADPTGTARMLQPNSNITATATIGSVNTANVYLIFDDLNTSPLTSLNVIGQNIYLKPLTSTTSIGIGGGTGSFNLDDREIGFFNAVNKFIIGDAVNGTGDITVDSWDLSGKTHNVELYGNDITFQDTDATAGVDYAVKLGTGNFTAYAKDNGADIGTLTANARFVKAITGSSKLDLLADRDIVFSSANIDTSTGLLNVQLNSDRNANNDGAISVANSAITTNGGYFVGGGGSGTLFGADGIFGTADDATSTGPDKISATGNATYGPGIRMDVTMINTGGGNLTLNAIGGSQAGGFNYGLALFSSNLLSQNGLITLNATGGNAGPSNHGFRMNVGNINSGTNQVILTATSGTGASGSDIAISAGTMGGAGQSGNLTLNANTFDNSGMLFTTTGTIFVKPRTAATAINLGGPSGTGTLDLSDGELAYFTAGNLIIGDAASGTGDITVDSWDLSGKSHNVELYGNDITFQDMDATVGVDYSVKLGTGNFTARAKDNGADVGTLTVNGGPIIKTIAGTSRLDLLADRDVNLATGGHITATSGLLNVQLNGDRNANSDGAVRISGANISTNGGYLVAGGGSGTLFGPDGIFGTADDATSTGADNVASWGNNTYGMGVNITNTSSISTDTGMIILNGHGANIASSNNYHGVYSNGLIQTSTGLIRIKGVGGNGDDYNNGVYLSGTTSKIISDKGAISITGTGGTDGNADSDLNTGVRMDGGALVQSTGTGEDAATINITGTGANADDDNTGVILLNTGTKISTTRGAVTINGTGGSNGIIGSVSNHGFYIYSGSQIETLGSAPVTITGQKTFSGTDFYIPAGGVIGGASATGDFTFNVNDIGITAPATIATTGRVTIKPINQTQSIGLGGASGGMSLDDAELGYISAGTLVIGDALNGKNDITVDSWDLSGKTHNVELYGNDITFQDTDATAGVDYAVKLGTGNFMACAKDNGADLGTITANARFVKAIAGTSRLDLLADRDIVFSNANIDTSTGLLNVQLNGDRNANNDGAVRLLTSSVTTNGGYLVAGGGSGALFGADGLYNTADDATSTGADNIASWGNSTYLSGLTIDGGVLSTGTGALILNGHGRDSGSGANYYGVNIRTSAELYTTSGGIKITGVGGDTTGASNWGVVSQAGTKISSATGSIFINGTGGQGGGAGNSGSNIVGNVESTGAAAITVRGTAGAASTGARDVVLSSGTVGGVSATGNVTIDADSVLFSAPIQTAGTVMLKPRTASTTIGLGGGGGTLNLPDPYLSYITAGTLIIGDAVNGTGDIIVDSWDLSGKTHNVELYGNDITFQDTGSAGYGVKLGTGNFTAYAKDNGADVGTLTANAGFTKSLAGTSTLDLRAEQDINFTNANISATNGKLNITTYSDANYAAVPGGNTSITNSTLTSNGGNIALTSLGTSDLTLSNSTLINAATGTTNVIAGGALSYTSPESFAIDTASGTSVLLRTTGTAKNITTRGQITASAAGNTATVAASGNFMNSYGASLFNMTGGGRWLVYSTNPTGNTRSGLTPNAAAIYGGTYATMAPGSVAAGNRFIFSDAAGNAPAITFTADNKSKTYGDANGALTYSVGGFVDADTVLDAFTGGVTLSTLVDQTSSAGAHTGEIVVTNNGLASNLGYRFVLNNGNYTVNKANLKITANDGNKTYGSVKTYAGTEFSSAGLRNADSVSAVTFTSAGDAATATVAGGPYAIVASNAAGSGLGNYNISYTNGSLTVDRANLLLTANNASKVYGTTKNFTGTEFGHSTLYNGDTVTGVTLTSTGAATTANVAGGPYAIVASNATGTGLGNYNISYADGALTVNKAALTITANDGNKTYGSGYTFTGNEFTTSTLYNSDAVTGVTLMSTGAAATAGAGSTYQILASNATGTGLDNYNISYGAGNLIVDKANLAITAADAAKTYGSTFTFAGNEYSAVGLINSDTLTGVTLSSAGTAATANVTGSPYAIVASNAVGTGLNNYNITYTNGALSVNRANLTIIANDASKTYGSTKTFAGNEITVGTLYNSDAISGVTLTSTGAAAGASVAGGPYAITASNATGTGVGNYNITYVDGALTVNRANLLVTANNRSKTYGSAINFAGNEYTTSALYNGDTVSGVTLASTGAAATANVAGGPYAIVASNATGTGLGNYTISYANGALTVNRANLTVTADNASKTYGSTYIFNGNEYTYSGLLNSDTLTGVTLASTGAAADASVAGGPYAITASNATGTGLGNYTINYVNGQLTLDRANLTITANNSSKTYGSVKSFTGSEFTSSGLLNSDSISHVTFNSSGAAAGASVAGGPYTITGSNAVGSGLGNYTINYVDGQMTVNRANLLITANNKYKSYGTAFAFAGNEFTTSTLYNGNTVTHVDLASAGTDIGAAVGVYGIAASNAVGTGLGNYTITYANGAMTVVEGDIPVEVPPAPVLPPNIAAVVNHAANLNSTSSGSSDTNNTSQNAQESFAVVVDVSADGDGPSGGGCMVVNDVAGGCAIH